MTLRNLEGVSRTPISPRNSPLGGRGERNQRPSVASSTGVASSTAPRSAVVAPGATPDASRGPFFDMMVAARKPEPAFQSPAMSTPATASRAVPSNADRLPKVQISGARILSADESAAVRGATRTATTVRNASGTPQDAAPTPSETTGQAEATPPTPQTPVEAINNLLTKLGYDPANFNARVTSSTISVPGLSYEYPLLEVTVNGERVGFHLPSAMRDPRMTAANISSMMGRPVMDLAVFA